VCSGLPVMIFSQP